MFQDLEEYEIVISAHMKKEVAVHLHELTLIQSPPLSLFSTM